MCCPAGLGKGLDDVLDTEELVNEADITAALQQPSPGSKGRRGRGSKQQGNKGGGAATPEKQAASELLGHSDSLSARERNKLKRKAKALERQSSVRLDSRGRVSEHGLLDKVVCHSNFDLLWRTFCFTAHCLRDTRTRALLCKQRWQHPGRRQSQGGSPQKRTDFNTSCVLQVAELLAEQRSNNARETSPGRGAQSPTAATAAAVAAAGAAAVLSDEQAAEQDLEEVRWQGCCSWTSRIATAYMPYRSALRRLYAWGLSTATWRPACGSKAPGEVPAAGGCPQWCGLEGVLLLRLLLQWHCVESGGWPFQRLADQLCCDVLSPVWTVRHGATAGLRELLREQAAAAAVEVPLEDINSGWACAGNSGTTTATLILWQSLLQQHEVCLQQASRSVIGLAGSS